MLTLQAKKKMQGWIRSRHLICSGNFFIFETLESSTLDRFGQCVTSLGGTLIWVRKAKIILIGNHRKVVLYRAKASVHTPHHHLKEYWFKYGGLATKFQENSPNAQTL